MREDYPAGTPFSVLIVILSDLLLQFLFFDYDSKHFLFGLLE